MNAEVAPRQLIYPELHDLPKIAISSMLSPSHDEP
jgi:hypothetical protein